MRITHEKAGDVKVHHLEPAENTFRTAVRHRDLLWSRIVERRKTLSACLLRCYREQEQDRIAERAYLI
jgi:hypothetical protein